VSAPRDEEPDSSAKQAEHATRAGASRLAEVMSRTARALEQSADLADDHARRQESLGRMDAAADERRAARQARSASQRAWANAERSEELGRPDAGR
jgi:hypothetical protein